MGKTGYLVNLILILIEYSKRFKSNNNAILLLFINALSIEPRVSSRCRVSASKQ